MALLGMLIAFLLLIALAYRGWSILMLALAAAIAVLSSRRLLCGSHPKGRKTRSPTKYQLVIDLKTAKALGLTMPPSRRRGDRIGRHVRYWPKADIRSCTAQVRFRG